MAALRAVVLVALLAVTITTVAAVIEGNDVRRHMEADLEVLGRKPYVTKTQAERILKNAEKKGLMKRTYKDAIEIWRTLRESAWEAKLIDKELYKFFQNLDMSINLDGRKN